MTAVLLAEELNSIHRGLCSQASYVKTKTGCCHCYRSTLRCRNVAVTVTWFVPLNDGEAVVGGQEAMDETMRSDKAIPLLDAAADKFAEVTISGAARPPCSCATE